MPKGAARPIVCDYAQAIAARQAARDRDNASADAAKTGRAGPQMPYVRQPHNCFLFAFMRDARVPSTFRVATPDGSGHIDEAGVTLQRMTVSLTDQPATEQIGRYLPWLDSVLTEDRLASNFTYGLRNDMPREIAYLRLTSPY
jgi:hypothetical protein